MDVDLSTDHRGARAADATAAPREADLAQSAHGLDAPDPTVKRSIRRELISRAYNRLLRLICGMALLPMPSAGSRQSDARRSSRLA